MLRPFFKNLQLQLYLTMIRAFFGVSSAYWVIVKCMMGNWIRRVGWRHGAFTQAYLVKAYPPTRKR